MAANSSKRFKKRNNLSPFQLFHGALNSPFQLKDDALWDTVLSQNSKVASIESHDLRAKYEIDEDRATKLAQAFKRHRREKEIFATVKKNRGKWDLPMTNANHNCNVAKNKIKMMLPSHIINQRLTQNGYLSIRDTLCFDPGFCAPFTEFTDDFECITNATFRLSESNGIESWGDIKSCIGAKRFFECRLIFDVDLRSGARKSVSFWTKICTDNTFIGNGQITHCMTVSNDYKYIELSDDIVVRATSTDGVLGIGYGNLIPPPRNKKQEKRAIDGHLMLWVHERFDIQFSFYRRSSGNINEVQNITVSLESKNLEKNKKKNPLVLFDYQQRLIAYNTHPGARFVPINPAMPTTPVPQMAAIGTIPFHSPNALHHVNTQRHLHCQSNIYPEYAYGPYGYDPYHCSQRQPTHEYCAGIQQNVNNDLFSNGGGYHGYLGTRQPQQQQIQSKDPFAFRYRYAAHQPQQLQTQQESDARDVSWNEESVPPYIASVSPEMFMWNLSGTEHQYHSDTDMSFMDHYDPNLNSAFVLSSQAVNIEDADENNKKRRMDDNENNNNTAHPSKKRRLN